MSKSKILEAFDPSEHLNTTEEIQAYVHEAESTENE